MSFNLCNVFENVEMCFINLMEPVLTSMNTKRTFLNFFFTLSSVLFYHYLYTIIVRVNVLS